MKITDKDPLARAGAGSRAGGASRVAGAPAARVAQAPAAAAVADVVSVMDIPANEFTPKVRAAIMSLMAEVEKLRRELQQSQARIQHLEELADQDTLAPVFNRRAFVRELSRMMSFAERYNAPSSVIYMDVNGLKQINDTYGHGAGDAVLSRVAHTLIASVRESDYVGRLGGDEFGVILANADHVTATEKAASLAADVQRQSVSWKGNQLSVSVSYGVSSFTGGQDANAALDDADRAMYQRKRGEAKAR